MTRAGRGPILPAGTRTRALSPGSVQAALIAADGALRDAAGRVDFEIARAAIGAAVGALRRGGTPAEPSHRAGSPGDGRGHGSVGHFLVLFCRATRNVVPARGRLALDTPKTGAE